MRRETREQRDASPELFAPAQSLRARKPTKAAAAAKARFETAWKRADVELERTAF